MPITHDQAVARYPELKHLATIRDAGWVFRVIEHDGERSGLAASRTVRRYTDALFIYDRHLIQAARVLDQAYGGGCVWVKDGTDLEEIVFALLALPEPDTRLAPYLVRQAPQLITPPASLWTP